MAKLSAEAVISSLILCATLLLRIEAKVFTHCELINELRRLQVPETQIGTWVCIAHYESRLNSSAVSPTGDHGIFQISEEYWCSPPGSGKGCGASCSEFEDDDITDDVACIQTIFDEHKDLSGDGFNAWAVYPRCKKPGFANRITKKCSSSSGGITDNSIDPSGEIPLDRRYSYQQPSPQENTHESSSYYYHPAQDYTRSSRPSSYYYDIYNTPSSDPFKSSQFSEQNPNREYTFSRTSPRLSAVYYTPSPDNAKTASLSSELIRQQVYTSKTSPAFSSIHNTPSPDLFKTGVSLSSKHDASRDYTFSKISPGSSAIYNQRFSSPTVATPPQILLFSPTKSSVTARPSSYNIGSLYYNSGFTLTPPTNKDYSSLQKSYGSSASTGFGTSFNKGSNYYFSRNIRAPQQYQATTRSDAAVVKTSSPAPPRGIKPVWADFPWWNGGKKQNY